MTPFTFGRNILNAWRHEKIIKGIYHMVLWKMYHNKNIPHKVRQATK
jgi:hypothetical protein